MTAFSSLSLSKLSSTSLKCLPSNSLISFARCDCYFDPADPFLGFLFGEREAPFSLTFSEVPAV